MGLLTIDHTQGQGLDGRRGQRWEYATVGCKHCGRIIALLAVPKADPLPLANIDIGRATPVARDLPSTYTGKRRCHRCAAPVCRLCAAQMEAAGGDCPGPLEAKIERALATGVWDESYRHDYGKTTIPGVAVLTPPPAAPTPAPAAPAAP